MSFSEMLSGGWRREDKIHFLWIKCISNNTFHSIYRIGGGNVLTEWNLYGFE